MRLVLASASERRRALLRRMGYAFETIPAGVDETVPPGSSAEHAAEAIAERKASAVATRVSNAVVIGADTLVAFRGEIIGKPRDRAHAVCILRRMRGTSQKVITGLCLIDTTAGRRTVAHETSLVTMARVSDEQIERYIASGLGDDKAGAYAVQEECDPFVESVQGSFDNVVGLPTELLERLLSRWGMGPNGAGRATPEPGG